jgi:HlyD family secretion protein
VKLAVKLVLASLLVGGTVPILVANFEREPDFFHFKWRLDTEPPVQVKLAPVGRGKITRTVEAPGKVEADVEVKISSQVMGRIINLPVHEGDRVKKGDLLVQLDRIQYEADVHSGESRVERLKASIELTERDLIKSCRDYERNQRMGQAVARMDLLDSRTLYQKDQARLAMSKAELIEAEAALTRSREDLVRTTIRSPLDGILSQLLAKEGEVVVIGTISTPGSVIMAISDPNSMVVRARVDENNVPLVRPGQKALVFFQNSAKLTLTGTVKRISPKGIPTGTTAAAVASSTTTPAGDNEVSIFETFISLEAPPPEVHLGMSASVEILVEERDGVVSIPSQAVLHRRAKDLPSGLRERLEAEAPRGPGVKDPARRYHQVVYVVEDGKARCRLVKTGISDENRVEVLDGVREGEQVIAGPYRAFDKLKDGRPVTEAAEKDDGAD